MGNTPVVTSNTPVSSTKKSGGAAATVTVLEDTPELRRNQVLTLISEAAAALEKDVGQLKLNYQVYSDKRAEAYQKWFHGAPLSMRGAKYKATTKLLRRQFAILASKEAATFVTLCRTGMSAEQRGPSRRVRESQAKRRARFEKVRQVCADASVTGVPPSEATLLGLLSNKRRVAQVLSYFSKRATPESQARAKEACPSGRVAGSAGIDAGQYAVDTPVAAQAAFASAACFLDRNTLTTVDGRLALRYLNRARADFAARDFSGYTRAMGRYLELMPAAAVTGGTPLESDRAKLQALLSCLRAEVAQFLDNTLLGCQAYYANLQALRDEARALEIPGYTFFKTRTALRNAIRDARANRPAATSM